MAEWVQDNVLTMSKVSLKQTLQLLIIELLHYSVNTIWIKTEI